MAVEKEMLDFAGNPEDGVEGRDEADAEGVESVPQERMEAGTRSEQQTEIPREVLWLLYSLVTFDVAVIMIIVPFLPAFFEDRLDIHGVQLGSRTGAVTSAFYLGNCLSSAYLGHLSDVHGRRPVLLFGLCASTISVLCFPLSTAFWMVVVNRFLCGFFNTNITISKACLADVTRDWESSRRASAFGYLGAAWGLSRFFASFFAGITTGITIPFIPLVADNPYFFPCFGISVLQAIATAFAFHYLPETRRTPLEEADKDRNSSASPALEHGDQSTSVRAIFGRLRYLNHVGGPTLVRVLCAHMLHQFLNGGILTIMVLFWALDASEGGFGLSSNRIGLVFGYFGAIGLVFQLTSFNTLVKAFGIRRMYYFGLSNLSLGSLLLWSGAKLILLTSSNLWRTLIILLTTTPLALGFMCGLPVLNNLLANSSPPEGVAQSTGAMSRMIGPIAIGSIYSSTVARHRSLVGFAIVSVLYFSNLIFTLQLPPSVEAPTESPQREDIAYPSPSMEQARARFLTTAQDPHTK